eukprot:gene9701-9860_t
MSLPAAVLYFGSYYAPADSIFKHTEFLQSMQWMMITYAAVSNPTIGKTTQKGLERSLGSIAGGLLGLMCALTRAPVVLFLGMLLAAMAGEVIVSQFKKENTGRLLPATYVLVSGTVLRSSSAWLVAAERVGAILSGILLCCIMSIVWHTTYVLWMLGKLLLDGFDYEQLERAVTSRYPPDMMSILESSSMAVLELVAACLHQAVSKHHLQHQQQQLVPDSRADAGGQDPQPLLL